MTRVGPDYAFLRNGGETGRLIAAHDWASTTLGPIEGWPQSLKTTIAQILQTPVPIVTLWGEEGWMIYNDGYSEFAGERHPSLLGSRVREGWPEVADFNDNIVKVVFGKGETITYRNFELVLNRTGEFKPVWLNLDYSPLLDEAGERAGVMAIVLEITREVEAVAEAARADAELRALNATLEHRVETEVQKRLEVEEVLRQAQKMEAVGQLTGGVAHDFNNLLTVILGGLDIVRRAAPADNARLVRAVDMATQGAQRAATLTSRLLAFSRRQPLSPEVMDLNVTVRDMVEMLHRTLGEDIELEGVFSPRLWNVEVDKAALESAILNLAVNARDAMPDGGKLTIETANTSLDASYAATDAEVAPGQYVAICISDNGAGMSKDTLARVFEPFFTTKEVGRGTGLGLSMVYGFVKQSGGHVTIYSEEGQGTTVKLYLPRFHGEGSSSRVAAEPCAPEGLKEVVLVVEDHEGVREFSIGSLTELGYTVLQAADADEALDIIDSGERIDLLFTDVVLPGRTGRVLADEALLRRPDLKVLFTTGYSRNAIVHQGRLDPDVQLLTKPFTFEQLATRVRDILDGR